MSTFFCFLFGWFLSDQCPDPSLAEPVEVAQEIQEEASEQWAKTERETSEESAKSKESPKKKYTKAPDIFPGMEWITDERYDSLAELEGKVVMIDFWTFGCINCQRALPHVVELHKKYRDQGFVVIGVHAPEFAYERKRENVIGALGKYGIEYPVVLDNDFRIWKNYKNRYWPAQYIIGRDGTLRYHHIGEGAYEEMDDLVATFLKEEHERI